MTRHAAVGRSSRGARGTPGALSIGMRVWMIGFVCVVGCASTMEGLDGGGGADAPALEVACGAAVCGADQYCVEPCCGGSAPVCVDSNADGSCPDGTRNQPCSAPGGSSFGCASDCVPAPPFCAPRSACSAGECPASGAGCFGGLWEAASSTFHCVCG